MIASDLSSLQSSMVPQWRQAISIGFGGVGRYQVASQQCEAEVEQDDSSRAADIAYDVHKGDLCITVKGPLDLRCIFRFLAIARAVEDGIAACRLNLEGVTWVFDSGIAALILLAKALTRKGIDKIRIDGLDLDQPGLSPYRMGSVAASMRRGFIWSVPGTHGASFPDAGFQGCDA